MAPEEVDQQIKLLDEQLKKGGTPINVSFGHELYDALKERGLIKDGDFPNAAYYLGVPGASETLKLPAYRLGGHIYANRTEQLAETEFAVGMRGVDAHRT